MERRPPWARLAPWLLLAAGTFALEVFRVVPPWSVLLLVILLAAAVLWAAWLERGTVPGPGRPSETRIPDYAWTLLFGAGMLLRLVRLTSLSAWPIVDEGQHGFYALEIAHQGVMRLFYGIAQLPPLFIWAQGLFFRWFGSSLATFWLPHALYGILGLGIALHLCRRYVPQPAGFLLGGFLALGFWPVWSARYAHWFSMGFLWEWMALWLLARAMDGKPHRNTGRLWALGLWLGSGFWVMIPWPGVAAALLFPVLWTRARRREGRGDIVHLLAAFAVGTLPFAVAAVRESYGLYITRVFSMKAGFDATAQMRSWIFYSTLPWLRSSDPNVYGSDWCGLFNPLAGALLVAGAWAAWRRRREPFVLWAAGSALFLMTPGFVGSALDVFRTMQAWPFLTFLAALGAQDLWAAFRRRGAGALVLFVLVSGALDAYHLFVRYPATWGNLDRPIPIMKNSELAEAHRLLRDRAARDGAGRILLNLRPDAYDQTLTIASDAFLDGPWAPERDRRPSWTAFLVNVHYRPFLAARYPGIEWHDLGGRLGWPFGYMTLAVIPPGAVEPATAARWLRADVALQPMTSFLLNRGLREPESRALGLLASAYPAFKGDPFLESCFFEKAYLYFTRSGDNAGAMDSLERALSRGYGSANFHYHMGHLHLAAGRRAEARRCFEEALKSPGNRTDAANVLGGL